MNQNEFTNNQLIVCEYIIKLVKMLNFFYVPVVVIFMVAASYSEQNCILYLLTSRVSIGNIHEFKFVLIYINNCNFFNIFKYTIVEDIKLDIILFFVCLCVYVLFIFGANIKL